MTQSRLFQLQDFLEEGEVFHLTRTSIGSEQDLICHHHDYVEVFWIKEGHGKHLVNGQEIPIQKGALWMMRSDDFHTFKMDSGCKGLVITNIAFSRSDLDLYKKRYFGNEESFFWKEGELPFHTILDKEQLSDISSLADKLLSEKRNYLHLDHILLHLFEIVSTENICTSSLPHWLVHALKLYSTPEYFSSGVAGFVQLTGRSVDHVNRVIRKHLKQTLTDTVNKQRLNYASNQLIMTNTPIKVISAVSGFTSLSYFHRLFKSKYGFSPKEYRDRNKKVF